MNSCPNCTFHSAETFAFCPQCGTKLPEGPSEASILGRTLNSKYRVLREVGSGSMGTVYEGEHISLKKRVALKVLHSDLQLGDESIQRFQREGIAAGQFSHPNAIQIFDFDRDDGPVFYLAMEFVEGLDLKRLIREEGAQSVEGALHVTRQILGALAEAHRHGIVHRDLKPENVMIIRGSGPHRVKVLDFGLSKLVDRPLDASLTEVGRVMGTPLYMSPEQVAGDVVDHRTDIYAVGLILYEMLSGHTPFSGKTLQEILSKHLKELPPSVVASSPGLQVPAALDAVLNKALEKRREDRFQTADEMLAALNAVDLSGPLATAARRKPEWVTKGSGGLPRWLVPVALVLMAVAALAWWNPFSGSGGPHGDSPRTRETPVAERTPAQREYLRLLDTARTDLANGETAAALARVQEALRSEVADAEAYLVRGLAYRAKNDDDTARLDFEEALNLDSGFAEAAAQLGWMRLDAGEREAALEHFLEAGRMDQSSPEALGGQSAVRLAEGRVEDARRLVDQALALDPDYVRGYLISGRTHLAEWAAGSASSAAAAVEAFVQAKRRSPGDWTAHSGLAQAYLATDRWEDAEQQFREAIGLAPRQSEPRRLLALAMLDRDRLADAAALLTEAVELAPEDAELRRLLGLTLADSGFGDGAIPQLRRAQELAPPTAPLHVLIGILEQSRGRLPQAAAEYRAALELDPSSARAHGNLGAVLMEQGDHEGARASLEAAVAADPDAPFPHLCLGALHMEFLGNSRLAIEHLRTYQDLGGTDPRAAEWLRRRVR